MNELSDIILKREFEDEYIGGLVGTTTLESGYIWAPYIPLVVTPTDPSDFNPVKHGISLSDMIYKTEEERIERSKHIDH